MARRLASDQLRRAIRLNPVSSVSRRRTSRLTRRTAANRHDDQRGPCRSSALSQFEPTLPRPAAASWQARLGGTEQRRVSQGEAILVRIVLHPG